LDILSVSMACGYENPRTFNREFKQLCGCTPREYRQKKQ
jgi:AraC-like DNA-binding protein